MAAVPLPGVAWPAGQEVGRPLVLHPLGEPQEHPGVVVPDVTAVGGAALTKHTQPVRKRCGAFSAVKNREQYNVVRNLVEQ